ncbi:hypothetical protein [Chryseobacterium vrystaatense]|uniref:Uncharacterized protein n=1 Tax=Chryseobacterium vrystaatense TaxID=307480 RepID=A0ABR4ULB9_9FLAO|nr:hypothetical protein [Chryseobacterium vrystaatense]KFF25702.1 hypothetical protein IW16_12505 [Chryseobacterium vrystaatense]
MATYESLIKITGSIGDLVFYSLNGKNVVRKKSGFNKNAFKKDPSYEKVRQNSSEFGHCSKAGKTIRSCIENYTKEAGDALLYQKFARLMTVIKDLDAVSDRGKRVVQNGMKTEAGIKLLKEFRFGEKENIWQNISIEKEQKNLILNVNDQLAADELIIITIEPDLEGYSAEYTEEKMFLKKAGKILFKKHFSDSTLLLYFGVLKNKGEITHMGFI